MLSAYPCPPAEISIKPESSSSVAVSWDPPVEFASNSREKCRHLEYRLRYKIQLNSEFTDVSEVRNMPFVFFKGIGNGPRAMGRGNI